MGKPLMRRRCPLNNVAANRVNTVQVAVLKLSADQANSAAISLARKIAPQVPQ